MSIRNSGAPNIVTVIKFEARGGQLVIIANVGGAQGEEHYLCDIGIILKQGLVIVAAIRKAGPLGPPFTFGRFFPQLGFALGVLIYFCAKALVACVPKFPGARLPRRFPGRALGCTAMVPGTFCLDIAWFPNFTTANSVLHQECTFATGDEL